MKDINLITNQDIKTIIFFGRLNNPASYKFNQWASNNQNTNEIVDIKYSQSENYEHSIMVLYKVVDAKNGSNENS